MHRLVVAILLLPLLLISCTGNLITAKCPDGEPIFAIKNIQDAYPSYVREYDASLSVTEEILTKAQVSATLKTKVAKLRQELDQERAELEIRQKSAIVALQTMPCDKTARDNAWKVLGDIKTKTIQIPDRVKQLNNDAAAKLESEVSNLLHYPDAARDIAKPPTIFEGRLANQIPRRLFDLLMNYNDAAILNVRNVGNALHDHKVQYYGFRQRVKGLEATLTPRIGEMVAVRFGVAWEIYFDYLVMRFGGNSQAQIIKSGNTLNYGITWDDCERVFNELSRDQTVSKSFSDSFAMHNSLAERVTKIVSAI